MLPGKTQPITRRIFPTRIAIGVSVFLFIAGPLAGLAHLSQDVRGINLIDIFEKSDVLFPKLSSFLWIFGPARLVGLHYPGSPRRCSRCLSALLIAVIPPRDPIGVRYLAKLRDRCR